MGQVVKHRMNTHRANDVRRSPPPPWARVGAVHRSNTSTSTTGKNGPPGNFRRCICAAPTRPGETLRTALVLSWWSYKNSTKNEYKKRSYKYNAQRDPSLYVCSVIDTPKYITSSTNICASRICSSTHLAPFAQHQAVGRVPTE